MSTGFTNYGAARALSLLIPNGTNFYVALFTTLPAINGTGGVEVAGAGYARVACSAWVVPASTPPGTTAAWANNVDVLFAAFSAAVNGVVGFGVFDALVGGNLIAFDNIVDNNGVATSKNFAAGDVAEFVIGNLTLGLMPTN